MLHLARRLDQDGQLRADVGIEEAANMLWVLCSFDSLDTLRTERGLSTDEAIELLTTMAERRPVRMNTGSRVCTPGWNLSPPATPREQPEGRHPTTRARAV